MSRIIKNITNTTQEIKDLGYFFEPGQETSLSHLPYGKDLGKLLSTKDIFLAIDNGLLVFKTANMIITSGEQAKNAMRIATEANDEPVSVYNNADKNLSRACQASLANLLNTLFYQHTESALMEVDFKNTFVSFGNDYYKTKQYENITSNLGCWQLDDFSASIVIDCCDDLAQISSQPRLESVPGHLELGEKWCIDPSGLNKKYTISLEAQQDWGLYRAINVLVLGQPNVAMQLEINQSVVPGSLVFLKNGWQTISFNIENISRKKVMSLGFNPLAMPGYIASAPIYICQISALKKAQTSYFHSGHIIFNFIETGADISEMFIHANDNVLFKTQIVYKITLDNGINWHTLLDNEFDTWLLTEGWNMSYRRGLGVRIEMFSEDPTVTPALDDFFVMYRLT